MKRWTRIGYAFGFAVVVGVLTVPLLALISKELLFAFFDSRHSWFQIYWFGMFAIAYLLAPTVSSYLKSRRKGSPGYSMGYMTRCAYAFAFTIVTGGTTLIVLALISREWAHAFIDDYYYAWIFLIAFLLAPTVNSYLKLHKRRNS